MSNSEKRTEYTVEQKAEEEGNKLVYDALKHLTTLNTGSLVILATFLEKFFNKPFWKPLVVGAFVCFTLSIVTAFISMFFVGDRVYQLGKQDKPIERFLMWGMIISVSLFLFGIILFIVFCLRNFFI